RPRPRIHARAMGTVPLRPPPPRTPSARHRAHHRVHPVPSSSNSPARHSLRPLRAPAPPAPSGARRPSEGGAAPLRVLEPRGILEAADEGARFLQIAAVLGAVEGLAGEI